MSSTVVVGAGVIGLWCAYELRRRGVEVTLVDRGQPGAECSHGNLGWITPSFSGPLPAPGVVRAVMRWIVRGNGPPYIKPGTVPRLAGWLWEFIRHCNARDYAQGLDALARLNRRTMALFAVMQRLGFRPPRPLSGDEARDLEPLSSAVAAGLLMEHERHVRPESVAAGLAKRLAALGVRLRFDTAVTGLRRRGAMLAGVETRDDVIEADHVVIAAGAWTGGLVRRLGGVLPVQAGKGYSITTTRGGVRITRPVYLDGARVGCSPYGDVL